jgi:DNA-binding transcriptional MerR regulator
MTKDPTKDSIKDPTREKDTGIKRLYYSISEVARLADEEQYVLRYWETEFEQLRPQKNRAGNRIYTPKDIEVIKTIKHLLRDRRFTIEGAKEAMRDYQPAEVATEVLSEALSEAPSEAPSESVVEPLPEPFVGQSVEPSIEASSEIISENSSEISLESGSEASLKASPEASLEEPSGAAAQSASESASESASDGGAALVLTREDLLALQHVLRRLAAALAEPSASSSPLSVAVEVNETSA